ncbi:hypothetical protein CIK05_08995 [Bdellovibrio sp. qaytius]|nr:hypothetical protein CIK05_08995 [Bdellovibrio sp. qaytius]
MINKELLYGIFDSVKSETTVNNGPVTESAAVGMVTFRRDGQISTVSGTPQGVMAYTGKFDLKDDQLIVQLTSCVVKEWVGTSISRKILSLDNETMVLEVTSPDGSICSKLTWKRAVKL